MKSPIRGQLREVDRPWGGRFWEDKQSVREPSAEHLKTFRRTGHLDDLQLEQFMIEDRQIVKTSEHLEESVPLEISKQDIH